MSASAEHGPRVGFLAPAAGLGGAERVLLQLLESWCAERACPAPVLLALVDGPLLERARALGVETVLLPLPPALLTLDEGALAAPLAMLRSGGEAARFLWTLRGRLRELRLDLLHTNGLKAHLLGALARPRETALTWHVHDYLSARAVSRRALRWLAARADGAVAVSAAQAADVRRSLAGRVPVEVVPCAVDPCRFSPQGAAVDLDALAGLAPAPREALRIGLVATYAPWKGQRTFLGAGARLLRGLPTELAPRLYVVGGPIYDTRARQLSREEVLGWASELGLVGRVGLVPFQTETPPVYRGLDVVVHASTQPEPFGLVVAEALACGRAVVAATTAGAVESLRVGEELLVTPAGDEAALAEALRTLALDSGLRARLGQAGRAAAEREFSPPRQLSALRAAWARFGLACAQTSAP